MEAAVYFIQDLAVIMLAAAIAGWVCKRIGLSPIVGYLGAGLTIGSLNESFHYVTDAARIEVLAQVGMVFLMFSIGLGLRLKRLRELGLSMVIATALTALLVLHLVRGGSAFAGFSAVEGLFLAGMFMVSSSAVIGKVLQDTGIGHQKSGRQALGITLLEDFVAVVMLTFLGSMGKAGDGGAVSQGAVGMLQSLGQMVGFVLLMMVLGLLLIPRLLQGYHRSRSAELETILVAGLLFGMSLLAVRAGYSLALGAFLLGVIVAETPRLGAVERAFTGLRDVFATVFFVAIGMTIRLSEIPDALWLILAGTLFCIVGRTVAATLALLATCHDGRTALRTALCLTPLGEFSFIIAGLGVALAVIPESFRVVGVGVSLLTSLIAPFLMIHSAAIADAVVSRPVGFWVRTLVIYRRFWESFGRISESSLLWRLCRFRLVQVAVEIALVTALLVFSQPVYEELEVRFAGEGEGLMSTLLRFYWVGLAVICLAPLVAIWRNVSAISMIVVDFLRRGRPRLKRLAGPLDTLLQVAGALILVLWFGSFLPLGAFRGWFFLALVGAVGGLLFFGWRKLIFWHSQLEVALHSTLEHAAGTEGPEVSRTFQQSGQDWGLAVSDCLLPDHFVHAGRTVAEVGLRRRTGASVVGIERQGFSITSVGPQTHLFPGDSVLLLGTEGQIQAARQILLEEIERRQDSQINAAVLEPMRVGPNSSLRGRTLAALNWPLLYAVQVAAVRREGRSLVAPGGDFTLQANDELLLLGTGAHLRALNSAVAAAEPDAL